MMVQESGTAVELAGERPTRRVVIGSYATFTLERAGSGGTGVPASPAETSITQDVRYTSQSGRRASASTWHDLAAPRPERAWEINGTATSGDDSYWARLNLLIRLDAIDRELERNGERPVAAEIRERTLELHEATQLLDPTMAARVSPAPIFDSELQLEWAFDAGYVEIEVRSDGRFRTYGEAVGIKDRRQTRVAAEAAAAAVELVSIARLYTIE